MIKEKHTDFELTKLQKQIDLNRRKSTQQSAVIKKEQTLLREAASTELNFTTVTSTKPTDSFLLKREDGYIQTELRNILKGVDVYVQTTAPSKPKLHDIWIKI